MHPLDWHALFSRGLASGSTRGLRLSTSPAATKKSVSIGDDSGGASGEVWVVYLGQGEQWPEPWRQRAG